MKRPWPENGLDRPCKRQVIGSNPISGSPLTRDFCGRVPVGAEFLVAVLVQLVGLVRTTCRRLGARRCYWIPPAAKLTSPVIQRASLEARKTATGLMSSGARAWLAKRCMVRIGPRTLMS